MHTFQVNMYGIDINSLNLSKNELEVLSETMPLFSEEISINGEEFTFKFDEDYHGNNCGDFFSGGLGFEIKGGIKEVIKASKMESLLLSEWNKLVILVIKEIKSLQEDCEDYPEHVSCLQKIIDLVESKKYSPEFYSYEASS